MTVRSLPGWKRTTAPGRQDELDGGGVRRAIVPLLIEREELAD
jgi:hypothetical protein